MSSWDFLKFCIAPDISGTVNFFTLSGKIMLFYNFTRVNKYARDNLKNMKNFLHKNASKNG